MEATRTLDTDAPEYCLRHPTIETALRCGNCEDLICPKCLVQTPVGARCPTCARSRPAPMYRFAPQDYALAIGTALLVGAGLGVAWWFLVPNWFGLFFAILAGAGMGWLMFSALDKVSRKRGPIIQGAAAAGLVLAYVLRNVLGADAVLVSGDLTGVIMVGVAIAVAVSQLR